MLGEQKVWFKPCPMKLKASTLYTDLWFLQMHHPGDCFICVLGATQPLNDRNTFFFCFFFPPEPSNAALLLSYIKLLAGVLHDLSIGLFVIVPAVCTMRLPH